MSDTFDSKVALWTQPISPEAPCGANARYEPEYETLLVEIAKLEAVDQGPVNWRVVVDQASVLVQTKTKDMVILGALCVGLLKERGFEGLAEGLCAYQKTVEAWRDSLFPPKERRRGRVSAYSWMTERLALDFEQAVPNAEDLEHLEQCLRCFKSLDALLAEEFDDQHPAVGLLKRAMVDAVELAKAAAPSAEARAGAPGEAGGAEGPGAARPVPLGAFPPKVIESEAQAEEVVRIAAAAIEAAAEFYTRKSEELEKEKHDLEERLKQADTIIRLRRRVSRMLAGEPEDEPPAGMPPPGAEGSPMGPPPDMSQYGPPGGMPPFGGPPYGGPPGGMPPFGGPPYGGPPGGMPPFGGGPPYGGGPPFGP
jgi:type VI secretion system protein VasJ